MMNKLFYILCVVACISACTTNDGKIQREKRTKIYNNQEAIQDLMPQTYYIAASRVTNKMLDSVSDIYESGARPTLYISAVQREENSVPEGFYYAKGVTRDIIEGSKTFKVVNNIDEAQYVLETFTAERGNSDYPVILYSLILSDENGEIVDQWSETVHKIDNDDRSWW